MNTILTMILAGALMFGEPPRVANKTQPEGDPRPVSLVEDLRIGPETHEDVGFWPGFSVKVAVNAAGLTAVADDRENRIVVFNHDGSLNRILGGFGQGPGEFQHLRRVQFLADGRLVAFEAQGYFAMTFFDKDLNYVEKITPRTAYLCHHYEFSPKADLAWADTVRNSGGHTERGTQVLKPNGDIVHTIQTHKVMHFRQDKMMEPAFWAEYIGDQLKKQAQGLGGFGAFAPDGTLYTAVGKRYEITQWRADGTGKVRTITRDTKPNRLTEAEIAAVIKPIRQSIKAQLPPDVAAVVTPSVVEKAIDHAGFLPGRMPINGLKVMEDGTLLVITDYNRLTGLSTADLFDTDGRFLGSFQHPNAGLQNMVFKNGYATTIETDEDDENTLVRYRIQRGEGKTEGRTPTKPKP
ncbi:hypothetical protein [Acanthopleuribacter pedis]|uniref:6-bladed beta-propeller n=1 Tax=Acanthopleuribacter pedis TaxID=442870 RepID=A0A8J7U8H4_9BACT|nr:hypothetical protein [Acanthopleuribacter pedis]MBO1322551.1 hypothetical protein [Acanthopleuribacter pedis]